MKKFLYLILLIYSGKAIAQDLNAKVQILAPQLQITNKRPLEVLETVMTDFLNNRKWSEQALKPNEKIDCSIVINLKEWDGSSNFKGEAQIVSTRPVFGSSYNTPILSMSDKNFDFTYAEGQQMDFADQVFNSNLTSLLAFYAYVIVGMDGDTFSKLGGSAYFLKAQTIIDNAQNAPFMGWKAFEGLRNRYWLMENINNKTFLPLRQLMYTYHREGLDLMSDDLKKGKKNIFNALPQLSELDKQKQASVFNQIFFSAKADEIIDIFGPSDPIERTKIYNILVDADPANTNKYEELKKSK